MKTKDYPMMHIKLFMREEGCPDPFVFDEDGHLITAGMTYDVSDAVGRGVDVFITLQPDIAPAEVAQILHKMGDWVERLLHPSSILELSRALEQRKGTAAGAAPHEEGRA